MRNFFRNLEVFYFEVTFYLKIYVTCKCDLKLCYFAHWQKFYDFTPWNLFALDMCPLGYARWSFPKELFIFLILRQSMKQYPESNLS